MKTLSLTNHSCYIMGLVVVSYLPSMFLTLLNNWARGVEFYSISWIYRRAPNSRLLRAVFRVFYRLWLSLKLPGFRLQLSNTALIISIKLKIHVSCKPFFYDTCLLIVEVSNVLLYHSHNGVNLIFIKCVYL